MIALADFFNASIDDLVGRTNDTLDGEFPRYKLLAEFYALDEETQALVKNLLRKLQRK